MRRYFNNGGSSFLETATKLTPGGAIGSIVKKIVKNKMLNRATAKKGGRMSFKGGGASTKGINKNAYGKNS